MVSNCDFFVAVAEFAVKIAENLIEKFDEFEAFLSYNEAELGDLFIPNGQFGSECAKFFAFAETIFEIFEEGVALFKEFFVLAKGGGIVAVGLAKCKIKVMASDLWTKRYEIEVFGLKENGWKVADVITSANGNTVEAVVFFASGAVGIKDFERLMFMVFFEEDSGAKIVLIPVDHFFEFGDAEGASKGGGVNCFNDIGFSKSILADKNM